MGRLGRAHAAGTVDRPLDATMIATRRVAATKGLTLDEAASSTASLTFRRSTRIGIRSTTVVIDFESIDPNQTRVSVSTQETPAIGARSRGRRLAIDILDGLSARRPLSLTD